MSTHRIPGRGRVDHARPVRFTFDGAPIEGRAGDTVASALLANGIHLMGRSFKYHRPRGAVTAGSEEPNALIGTRRGPGRFEPNTRATVQEIYDGLTTESQNKWPSLKFDVGAVNDRLYMLFSAGFYYKTFMWPKSFWDKVYEPVIRAAAGLGKAPSEPDPDTYASRYLHCDVLVIGAGPAGIAAALEAGRSGARTVLVDESSEPGGSLLGEPAVEIAGQPAWDWLAAAVDELRALPNVTLMSRTTAIGYYHQNMVGLCQKLTDHLAALPEGRPARADVARPRRPGRARPGRAGTPAGLRRQRPSRRHAGGLGPDLPQPLWRQGRQPRRRRHLARQRLGHRLRPGRGRRHRGCDRRHAPRRGPETAGGGEERKASRRSPATPSPAPGAGFASPRCA